MEISCPSCPGVFVRDYSKEVKQSSVKAVGVMTQCPICKNPLYFIITEDSVTYLGTHSELLWTYELLFAVKTKEE
jgi:hypothetical protein